jgi:hypothetical protein
MKVLPNGEIVPDVPAMLSGPPIPKHEGSMLDAAAKETLEANKLAAKTYKEMGAGQKGGAYELSVPEVPEKGTIKGISFANNYKNSLDILNQARTNAMYDGLGRAPARQVGGKKRRRTKRRYGRRSNRTHRRKHGRNSRSRRGRSRRVV